MHPRSCSQLSVLSTYRCRLRVLAKGTDFPVQRMPVIIQVGLTSNARSPCVSCALVCVCPCPPRSTYAGRPAWSRSLSVTTLCNLITACEFLRTRPCRSCSSTRPAHVRPSSSRRFNYNFPPCDLHLPEPPEIRETTGQVVSPCVRHKVLAPRGHGGSCTHHWSARTSRNSRGIYRECLLIFSSN